MLRTNVQHSYIPDLLHTPISPFLAAAVHVPQVLPVSAGDVPHAVRHREHGAAHRSPCEGASTRTNR